ncbi:MAG TPA: hypothetical protein VGR35_04550 [Tepidisphaeraceae bacterium]|nr:hypothetical protein [Tepidisphaeraceae bacterium]
MRDRSDVIPVRRRRSIFSIIGMIVVVVVVAIVLYFAWVGWSDRGRPVPDVDVKTTSSAVGTSPAVVLASGRVDGLSQRIVDGSRVRSRLIHVA